VELDILVEEIADGVGVELVEDVITDISAISTQ
jgi:hypothetical protein